MSWYRNSSPLLDLLKLREPNLNIFISGVLLKRTKNELRNRIGQNQLSSLSIMSNESDTLRQLVFSQLIIDFSNLKSRKRPI